MAGNLPDPIGYRFAIDVDGTSGRIIERQFTSTVLTLNFANNSPSADTITRTTGSWITDGITPFMVAIITGANTPANNGSWYIAGVTDTVLTLSQSGVLTNDAGDTSHTITIYKHDTVAAGSGGTVSAADMVNMNSLDDEDDVSEMRVNNGDGPHMGALIFPELRDITQIFSCNQDGNLGSGSYSSTLQYSSNTTDGLDGSWTNWGTINFTKRFTIRDKYRADDGSGDIINPNLTGVKGLRWVIPAPGATTIYYLFKIHIWGRISASGNYLRIWEPSQNAEMAYRNMDFGNTRTGTTEDKTFRIKNSSNSATANNIVLTMEVQDDSDYGLPLINQFQIKKASDLSFSTSTTITALTPGEISEVITLRRTTVANYQLGNWELIVRATAGSWT